MNGTTQEITSDQRLSIIHAFMQLEYDLKWQINTRTVTSLVDLRKQLEKVFGQFAEYN